MLECGQGAGELLKGGEAVNGAVGKRENTTFLELKPAQGGTS